MKQLLLAAALTALIGLIPPPVIASSCAECHDAIHPHEDAPGVDIRRWERVGVHSELGCTACHPQADLVPHRWAASRVACASCHEGRGALWSESVHGRLDGGEKQLAGCRTCHVEHQPFSHDDPAGRYLDSGLRRTCVSCHEPRLLARRQLLPVKPAPADDPYPSTVHGLIVRGDRVYLSDCASCHSAHEILPADDPRSPVNGSALTANCGGCHELPANGTLRVCSEQGRVTWTADYYFDFWYLWTGGVVILSLLLLAASLAVSAALRRRQAAAAR